MPVYHHSLDLQTHHSHHLEHHPSSTSLPQEPFPDFPTAAAVPAFFLYSFPLPLQCLLPQEPFLYSYTAAAVPAPAGAFLVFPHCRSSVRSRRSLFCIPTLLQQHLFPQESFLFSLSSLYFHTAAVVSALTGAFLSISPLPQQCPHQHKLSLYFYTATVVSAPTGAFPVFPHCRSSVTPSGAFSLLPYCRSSVRSRRSLFSTSTLPQQRPL
ncbi:hypothetical protein ROHU_000077 [Labeo rohita]|uniref:Uncharacterized protein n=1 Tax=Labeo rohita TaxID=84645 RepID=A0A498P6L8_LABRO|nr:hypothetical protein ROHU_000077 [Labeo rohita]